MADEPHVADASDEAKAAALAKMQAALKSDKDGDIVKDQASLETDVESRKTISDMEFETKRKGKKGKEEKLDTTILKNVKVYSPYHVYFDGDAQSVSAENLTGPFDVLPGHKAFMSLLIPGQIIIRSSRGEEKIQNDRAVMHVRNNMVTIFLDV